MKSQLHDLDTNVLISIVEPIKPLSATQSAFLKSVERCEVAVVASEFALSECRVKPYADNNQKTAESYLSLFQSSRELIVVPVSRDVLLRAARVRAKSRMSLPDAVHVATAEMVGCKIFPTDDRGISVNAPVRLSSRTNRDSTQ